jgi:K+-transporting ATPase A subunit
MERQAMMMMMMMMMMMVMVMVMVRLKHSIDGEKDGKVTIEGSERNEGSPLSRWLICTRTAANVGCIHVMCPSDECRWAHEGRHLIQIAILRD